MTHEQIEVEINAKLIELVHAGQCSARDVSIAAFAVAIETLRGVERPDKIARVLREYAENLARDDRTGLESNVLTK